MIEAWISLALLSFQVGFMSTNGFLKELTSRGYSLSGPTSVVADRVHWLYFTAFWAKDARKSPFINPHAHRWIEDVWSSREIWEHNAESAHIKANGTLTDLWGWCWGEDDEWSGIRSRISIVSLRWSQLRGISRMRPVMVAKTINWCLWILHERFCHQNLTNMKEVLKRLMS